MWADEQVLDDAIDKIRFNDQGLVPVIAQSSDSGQVLMLAWMDAEAVRRTLTSGLATYWSRSRSEYWVKGETSGHRQLVKALRRDCDSDALLMLVEQAGPACHTGAPTCFNTHPDLPLMADPAAID
ncbi:MAG: phosphoribosyl-AMP cyclohydrolase [Propionibacteriaceae bacterium]|jgi:phosphoribosyl-AMP cyclohydrolase|nr:phosphoribosyl-AMP cyclohydrolase [Propionibacteriaceae bacterium]